jgi:hypothetical protein
MFDDWKQAWREAVANFQRELDHDGGDEGTRAMRRDERTTADALRRLDSELSTARSNAAAERASEAVCRRREGQARTIGDGETEAIAAEYATRHAERALILERKVEVLVAERALVVRDLERMRSALAARVGDPQVAAGAPSGPTSAAAAADPERAREEHHFRKMEREARERAAEARLEELKRKLR